MKTNLVLASAILIAGTVVSAQAETKDDVNAAIKQLADKVNYTWTSTSKRPGDDGDGADAGGRNRFRSGPTTGKTAGGLVHVSNQRGDRTSESLLNGKKIATKGEDGWALVEESPAGGNDGQRRGRGRGRNLRNFQAPTVQAAEILETVAELKKDGDTYTEDLTESAAKALLPFGGGRRGGGGGGDRPEPTGVKASAKFWIKDGILSKYETSIAGSISFNGNERDLSRVTTVEIKDVGTTKIDVTDETKKLVAGAE